MAEIEINRKKFKFEDKGSWETPLQNAMSLKSFDVVAHTENDSFFFQMFRDGGKGCLLQCRADGYQLEAALPEITGSQAKRWIDLYCSNDMRFEKVVDWKKTKTSKLADREKAFYKKLSWGKSVILTFGGLLLGMGSFFLMGKWDLLTRMPELKPLVPIGFLTAVAILSYDFRWQRIHNKKLGIPFSAQELKGIMVIVVFLIFAIFSLLPDPDWFWQHRINERRRSRGQTIIKFQ